MDIELTVNAMELAPACRSHRFCSRGMEIFGPWLKACSAKGYACPLWSTVRSQPPMIADELRRQADNFIELEGLRDVLGRPVREDDSTDEIYNPE